MRTFFRAASILALGLAVVHCGFLKKKTDETADAEAEAAAPDTTVDAAPVDAAPAATAANEADIARFPDEVKMDNVPAVVKRQVTARDIPQSGKQVAILANGQAVTQIAQREKFFLVTFPKPGEPATTLMGWISADAYTALTIDAGLKPITCTAPEVPLYSDSAFCGRVCTKDADCGANQACKGTAQTFTAGKIGTTTQVCTVFKPTTVDAGTPATVVDAGTQWQITGDTAVPHGILCPVGFVYVNKDKACHRACVVPQTCTGAKNCVPCEGKRVCSTNAAFCK